MGRRRIVNELSTSCSRGTRRQRAFQEIGAGPLSIHGSADWQKLKQWSTERQIETLYRHIGQVRKVKTIWQIDKAVDLIDFYCDSHVISNDKRKKICKLSDFGTGDNILIQGIAGQGKSILMRYLCSVELVRGEYIPIYLELRRVSDTQTLKDRIFTAFQSLQLPVDDVLFDALAISGKILLLLDAFDEVPDELKTRVLTEIEDLGNLCKSPRSDR